MGSSQPYVRKIVSTREKGNNYDIILINIVLIRNFISFSQE